MQAKRTFVGDGAVAAIGQRGIPDVLVGIEIGAREAGAGAQGLLGLVVGTSRHG